MISFASWRVAGVRPPPLDPSHVSENGVILVCSMHGSWVSVVVLGTPHHLNLRLFCMRIDRHEAVEACEERCWIF
jgi:hypothetical protein